MAGQVFKRFELKYMLTVEQHACLKRHMEGHMVMDDFGRHHIHNIYFDTPDFLLIRRSMDKPEYKEKLRVRSYGDTTVETPVFVEMKKKYAGEVFKRRLNLPQDEAFNFLLNGTPMEKNTQIGRELEYFMKHYQNLVPAVALHYQREAYFCPTDDNFRMTFDQCITANMEQVSLVNLPSDLPVLEDGKILLEVKTSLGMPQWLMEFFAENEIYKASFSKYGTAYEKYIAPTLLKGDVTYVA